MSQRGPFGKRREASSPPHLRRVRPHDSAQCVLKCPCRKREEEWLAPYVPPEDLPNSSDEEDSASDDSASVNQDPEAGGGDDDDASAGSSRGRSVTSPGGGGGEGSSVADGSLTGATALSMSLAPSLAPSAASSFYQYPEVTVQQHHEEFDCPRRLVSCPRRCGEWINYEDLDEHMDHQCVKRPFPPLACRLGCGETFSGGFHRMIQVGSLLLPPFPFFVSVLVAAVVFVALSSVWVPSPTVSASPASLLGLHRRHAAGAPVGRWLCLLRGSARRTGWSTRRRCARTA